MTKYLPLLLVITEFYCSSIDQPGLKDEHERLKKSSAYSNNSNNKKEFGSAHEEFESVQHTSAESTVDEVIHHDEKDSDFAELKRSDGSGLKAGYTNDNKEFNHFIQYLDKYSDDVEHYDLEIKERIILTLKDSGNKNVFNANVKVFSNDNLLTEGKTFSDGSFTFYPSQFDWDIRDFKVIFNSGNEQVEGSFSRDGKRQYEYMLPAANKNLANIPLDIVFTLDTTASMREEINQLRDSINSISQNLSLITKSKIRYGIVFYKDKYDDYVTKVVPLTSDLNEFKRELSTVTAYGGSGDYPEDLQSALRVTLQDLKWNPEALKISFVITDAPPHLNYKQKYTYENAAKDAVKQGIKLFTVGAGGLPIQGEYILRQIAQYTGAKYIYLAREKEAVDSLEHHEDRAIHFDRLETIILRFTKEELNYAKSQIGEESENILVAQKKENEPNNIVTDRLFDKAISQLIDYSTITINNDSNVVSLPISFIDKSLKPISRKFEKQLLSSIEEKKEFELIAEDKITKALSVLNPKQSPEKEENKIKFGKSLNAKFIINSNLTQKGVNYELLLRLINVETEEVLSVTKLKIQKSLIL